MRLVNGLGINMVMSRAFSASCAFISSGFPYS
jgi:hypothetical protein